MWDDVGRRRDLLDPSLLLLLVLLLLDRLDYLLQVLHGDGLGQLLLPSSGRSSLGDDELCGDSLGATHLAELQLLLSCQGGDPSCRRGPSRAAGGDCHGASARGSRSLGRLPLQELPLYELHLLRAGLHLPSPQRRCL